ncbi:hypothetical protein LINPERPRIM_LOCUS24156, partial [Linum perenne]
LLLSCRGNNGDQCHCDDLQRYLDCFQSFVCSITAAAVHHMGPVPGWKKKTRKQQQRSACSREFYNESNASKRELNWMKLTQPAVGSHVTKLEMPASNIFLS